MQKPFTRMFSGNKKLVSYVVAVGFLLLAIFLGIAIGAVHVPFKNIAAIIWREIFQIQQNNEADLLSNIVMNIRLPRVILAGLVGAALAMAGAAFQGLLRNPLADPYTLGVSSGASVGAVVVLFFQLSLPFAGIFTLPLLSIAASFITIFLVLFFARTIEPSMKVETIILTGIIFSSFLGAVLSLMIALSGEELRQIIGWLLGSVSMRGWSYVRIILPFFIIGGFILMMNVRELNAMSFGEDRAK